MPASAAPDIRAYLEIRTASPASWSPDGRRLLISSDLPGTFQVHRLDLIGTDLPAEVTSLARITDFVEPARAGYLPADAAGEQPVPSWE